MKGQVIRNVVKTAGKVVGKAAKTIIKHPKGTGRVLGVAKVVDGISDVAKGLKNKRPGKVLEGLADTFGGAALAFYNHPEWYENYPLNGLIGANFARRKGQPELGIAVTDGNFMSVPGVARCGIRLMTTNDPSGSYEQSINIMYNHIRSANSGSINYTPGQLSQYIEAIRSIRAHYYSLRRAYSVLNNFSAYDAIEPASLIAAMGYDYDTFRDGSANLYSYLNIMGRQIRELCPLNIDLLDRTKWMFSNIFADSNDVKASKYVFSLVDATTFQANSAGTIVPTAVVTSSSIASPFTATTTGMDLATALAAMDTLMRNFSNSGVFQIIAGDILKAFGEQALFEFEMLKEHTPLPIVYDEAALTQIQNATVFSTGWTTSMTRSIDSTTGMYKTKFSVDRPALPYSATARNLIRTPFINTYKNSLTSAELIASTRFTLAYPETYVWGGNDPLTTDDGLVNGTEIFEYCTVILRTTNSSNEFGMVQVSIGYTELSSNASGDNALAWSAMDWAPFTVLHNEDRVVAYLFDFNNYARITDKELSTYHAYAGLSLMFTEKYLKPNGNLTLVSQ